MTAKIDRFFADSRPQTPCVVIDLDIVEDAYQTMRHLLPLARVFYAVKANPAAPILDRLTLLGSCFDTASRGEIELVLAAGATPERISFGNTIKKQRDIEFAYRQGVRLFAFDSIAELHKLAESAPGSRVFCRILVECEGAEWPLSRKFGCSPAMAADLLAEARRLGLDPYGVSFHVGSQQTDLSQWDRAVGQAAEMFSVLAERDIMLKMINIGGGFPAHYRQGIAPMQNYADAVMTAITKHFGNDLPEIIIEPGRSMVGDAGVLRSEVVLISTKDESEESRWVYLDVGKFNGLAETMDEAIKYVLRTPRDGHPTGRVILAGPTCDSADILYERADYQLPMDLAIGDTVDFLSTGAYTTTYASVGFNGFQPLQVYCI